jgi:hypothetical protein
MHNWAFKKNTVEEISQLEIFKIRSLHWMEKLGQRLKELL